MLHGQLADGVFEYQLAVLNGTGENQGDDNSAKDLAGRLVFRRSWRTAKAVALGAHMGVSGTWGRQDRELSSLAFLTVGGAEFVDFAADTALKGNRSRLAAEFVWLAGPASLKTEWMWMWLEDLRGPTERGDFRFDSWYVSASCLLTGEKKSLARIVPERPFSPSGGSGGSRRDWGAWELAARYSRFNSDGDLFRLGMASGISQAEAFTLGLNWYLNQALRITLNYEHTEFDDDLLVNDELVHDEDAFLIQAQLEF
jgi:phosphate-selective porin OprO/OprP